MRAVITYMAKNSPALDQIPQRIKHEVHSWDGNLNLFEVYDSIKDRPSREINQLLRYAVQRHHGACGSSFQGLQSFVILKELAWHFSVPLDNEDE